MLAYVATPDAPDGLELREVPRPDPRPSEAVVAVGAFSLNRGEVGHVRARTIPAGTTVGWDVAGVVVQAAADGSGPAAGSAVFGCSVSRGTWAQLAAVSTSSLAVLPPGVSPAAGSTLGVAGLTAIYAVRYGGSLLGRTVIVTGAAGGVGRLAVQLAARSGAHVIAVVGDDPARAATVFELGLDHVEVERGLAATGAPAHLILESAGGDSLSAAFARIGPGGTIVLYGRSSEQPGRVPPDWFFRNAQLHGLSFARDMDVDGSGPATLAILGDLVASGRLDPGVGWESSWQDLPAAMAALLGRHVGGKAVLHVDEPA
ncbi:MAG TPA: zinc-binding dehydrogenase [Acidimicrobiales bacterium]|nr:zinc-binding dehydrogenase [Acidimicrobiales bacterium]